MTDRGIAVDVLAYTTRPFPSGTGQRGAVVIESTLRNPATAGRVRSILGHAGGFPVPSAA